MAQLFTDNAFSTLASSIGSGATSISLATGEGARFPSPSGGDYFDLTLTQAGSETQWEIVRCTARSSDTLTVTRGQEGTSALGWTAGDKAEIRITATWLNNPVGRFINTFTAAQRTEEVTDNDGSFDLNAAVDFKCTPTAGFTLTFTNIPSTPAVQKGTIVLVNGSNYAVAAHANTKVESTTLAKVSASGTYELFYRSSNGVVYVTASGAMA